MKKKKVNSAKTDRLWFASDPEVQKVMHHFLSPLQMEAFKHNFAIFTYDLDGVSLHIDANVCSSLLFDSKMSVKYYYRLVRKARILEAMKDPKKRAFLLSDPGRFPEINQGLINRLCRRNFGTMGLIAQEGNIELGKQSGIGPMSVKTLQKLFRKHKCEDLFIS